MAISVLSAKRQLQGALALAVWLAAWPAGAARAYSDPFSYEDSVAAGGGGGRWFTGSPADGYGCDACHEGAPGPVLNVVGLPVQGFIPGMSYEVSLFWPPTVPHMALIAEFSDELRQGAGTLALPRADALREFEVCAEQGFPAAELHEAEAQRTLISVIDCGARMVRFQWTAPAVVQGPIWFNAGFVQSNADAAPGGDGVTLVRRPLSAMGSLGTRTVAQGCSASPRGAKASGWGCFGFALAALALSMASRWRLGSMREVR